MGLDRSRLSIDTLLVHAGAEPDPTTGAVAPPLHLSTTFVHGPASEPVHGYLYARHGNPTEGRLEDALARIEGGERALVFATGMAAIATLLESVPPGSHVLLADDGYYDVRTLAGELASRGGLAWSLADLTDLDAVRRALRPSTRLVLAETPTNPLLKVVDLAALATVVHEAGAELAVDNTFATPVLQRPLALGADVVVHSTTKYIGGHHDTLGGALVWRRGERAEHAALLRTVHGNVASPFNAWLALRGLRSLACRVERHAQNAATLAAWLESHAAVRAVNYPGLASNAGHEIARRQMRAFGGMLSFRVASRDAALAVCEKVELFTVATSLGGPESLIEHRASVEGRGSRTSDDLLRVSVGLEDVGDLRDDLARALS